MKKQTKKQTPCTEIISTTFVKFALHLECAGKVVVKWFVEHVDSNIVHKELRSVYKQHHHTETALMKVHNNITQGVDRGMGCLVLFLNRLVAFDTDNTDMFMDILHNHLDREKNRFLDLEAN